MGKKKKFVPILQIDLRITPEDAEAVIKQLSEEENPQYGSEFNNYSRQTRIGILVGVIAVFYKDMPKDEMFRKAEKIIAAEEPEGYLNSQFPSNPPLREYILKLLGETKS